MDHIRKAILKAKAARQDAIAPRVTNAPKPQTTKVPAAARNPGGISHILRAPIQLSSKHLEENHVVSHLPHSPYTIGFDILRTRVFQTMMEKGWKTILVTSPTPNSGKTVTSINLAISLARQPNCFSVLVDTDLRKPSIANYLGIRPDIDLIDVVTGHHTLEKALYRISLTGDSLAILPTRQAVQRPSEVLSSSEMQSVVASIHDTAENTIVVFDAPPMLIADDVLAFMPYIDCVLLIVSPDWTNYVDTEACLRHIPPEKLVGTVFAKSLEANERSYYSNYNYTSKKKRRK